MSSRLFMFFILGVVFTLIGTLTVLIWPIILQSIVNGKLPLSNGSDSSREWKDSNLPMQMEVFLFNWTNPGKDGTPVEPPHFDQLGPYVFRENRHKVNLIWNDHNSTVTYLQNRTWFFDPTLSNGSLTDLVTTVNVPAITTASALREFPTLSKIVNIGFKAFGIGSHVTKSVQEFVFDGYTNPIMDIAKVIPKHLLPFAIPFDKFGWFYMRNGSATYDGVFNIKTGQDNISELGKLSNWNYMNQTQYYRSYCGRVNGSAGELFGPGVQKTRISFYSPDLCRPLNLKYEEDINISGIPSYRFTGDPAMLYNKTDCPDNWCFAGDLPSEIHPDGVLNISACKWGAPIFASFPHFYLADPVYLAPIRGLSPDPTKHKMILDVEPMMGVPVHASAAVQINVLVQPISHFTFLEKWPKIFFPCIWFREVALVNGTTEAEMKSVASLASIPVIMGFAILALGVTALIITGVVTFGRHCKKDDDDLLLISDNSPEDDEDT